MVTVYVYNGVKCPDDPFWGNTISYEDEPHTLYVRKQLHGEVLPAVYETMVNRVYESGHEEQLWVKEVVVDGLPRRRV